MPVYVSREVRIREVYKRVPNTNPLCGAAFDEVGEPIAFEIVGPWGVVGKHRQEAKAITALQGWQEYYDKMFDRYPEMFERIR